MSDDFKPDVTGKWKSVKTSEFKKIVFLTMAEKTPNGVTKITGSAKMGSNKLKLNGVRKGKSVTLEATKKVFGIKFTAKFAGKFVSVNRIDGVFKSAGLKGAVTLVR